MRLHVLGLGVVAPHEPLQLGEFADHAGHEIGLGQLRRAPGEIGIGVDGAGDLARQLGDAHRAVPLRAELLVESDAFELEAHRLELLLEILVPEELGVGEPRPDHLLVAGDDGRATVGRGEVRDHQELVGELLGPRVTQREALLVRLHRGHQALGRHVEEGRIERAHQHDRPFGQSGVLGRERVILDQCKLGILGELVSLDRDHLAAAIGIEHDLVAFELLLVVGEALDLERLVAVEAVAARQVGAGGPRDLERDGFSAEDTDDRLQGTHPLEGARAPAHRLRPRELGQHRRDHLGDDLGGGAAGLFDAGDVEIALFRIRDDRRLVERGEARRLEEALNGLLRCSDSRPLALLADRRRGGRHTLDDEREAARRGVAAGRPAAQALGGKSLGHQLPQVFAGALLHARGNLFGQQLEEEFGHEGWSFGMRDSPSLSARCRTGEAHSRRERDRARSRGATRPCRGGTMCAKHPSRRDFKPNSCLISAARRRISAMLRRSMC